ncbi:MAG TPA: hypothetical protein VNK46_06585 [Nitrospiraceae bacterium]|jgi:hypothetical protein|nr:hypothetical protein [Nitrospiraceae bacterium]
MRSATAFARIGVGMMILLLGLSMPGRAADMTAQNKQAKRAGMDPARLVTQYVEAMAAGKVAEWAAFDLGCLARHRQPGAPPDTDKVCWDDTMKAHRALVDDEPETGIFGAVGRGIGFGLIAETHRQADSWKNYPPGIFVSPAVVKETTPKITVKKVWPARSIAIQEKSNDPVAVRGTLVEVRVTYPDPLTAPLALKPGEVWWASGQIRRYGPVREVDVRFVVVSGLQKLGYVRDSAVVNEALTDAPQIPGARYGLDPDNIGRAFERPGAPSVEPSIKGGLVVGSARWWTKREAAEHFRAGLERAKHSSIRSDRLALLKRLLLIDPDEAEANRLLGTELFESFLDEGLKKSGMNAADKAVKRRLAELYWNIQAPTWRQELTAVTTGEEPAAEALYGAIAALEIVVNSDAVTPEIRRRLGALYRWNGDAEAALAMHEQLLKEATAADGTRRGALLSEMAWDRVQWLAWNRRYAHPWHDLARREAEQALELVEDPLDKMTAAQALLLLETLSLDRTPSTVQDRVRLVKHWHDRVPLPVGMVGVWAHLVGNDLVKALVPEGTEVTLPSPVRSQEVLDVAVHANPPTQDLLRVWEFDNEPPGSAPRGFLISDEVHGNRADWRIEVDPEAPSAPQVLTHHAVCSETDCVHALLTEEAAFGYVDVTVRLKLGEGHKGRAGIAVGEQNGKTIYAATVNPTMTEVAIHRIEQGRMKLLGTAAVKPKPGAWHLLRIQRENFAHLSRPRLALFFDGAEVLAVSDEPVQQGGRVGLISMGSGTAKFDGFRILKLVSNEPLSPAAAY